MKHCSPCVGLVFFFLVVFGRSASAQDLFDRAHTAEYAAFLFRSGNYLEAAREYERMVFTFDTDNEEKLRLVQSYRLGDKPYVAAERLRTLWDRPERVSPAVSKEMLALQIINDEYDGFETLVNSQVYLPERDRLFFLASAYLLQQDYQKAYTLLDDHPRHDQSLGTYMLIAGDALAMKTKSPVVGGLMSALVPGTGKMYTGNWQDGLISMSIVGMSAWQAYRGFEKRGISSVYGWVYAVVGAAFHAGNIYGSIKEVNRYNHVLNNRIRIRVQAVFYNSL